MNVIRCSSFCWGKILMIIVLNVVLSFNGFSSLSAQDRRNNLINFIVSLNSPFEESPIIQKRKQQIEKIVWKCIKHDSYFKHQKNLRLFYVFEAWSDASFLTDKSYRDGSFLSHLYFEFSPRWIVRHTHHKNSKKALFAGYVLIVDNQGKYLGQFYQGRLWQNHKDAEYVDINTTLSNLLYTQKADYVFYYPGLLSYYLCIRESDASMYVIESTLDGYKRYSWDEALDKWGVSR